MGAWGYGLFQSDPDLDHAGQLSEETGVELFHPDDPEEARRILDDEALAKTFDRYLDEILNVGGFFEPFRAPWPRSPDQPEPELPWAEAGLERPPEDDDMAVSAAELNWGPRCWNCTEVKEDLRLCGKCKKAAYCGSECQKKDWKVHKKLCTKAEQKA